MTTRSSVPCSPSFGFTQKANASLPRLIRPSALLGLPPDERNLGPEARGVGSEACDIGRQVAGHALHPLMVGAQSA